MKEREGERERGGREGERGRERDGGRERKRDLFGVCVRDFGLILGFN
jgi:hypothetical protein